MQNIAFVFPGQGSQVVGMGRDFFDAFAESREVFETASEAAGIDLRKICFEGPLETLTLTENLQPALFTVEAAILAAVRTQTEIQPSVCAGHSLGEYTALTAAGSLSVADGARLTRRRGQAMQGAVPVGRGTMAAILGLSADQVVSLCRKATAQLDSSDVVEPANFNAPGQVVIAGSVDGVSKAAALLKEDAEFKGGRSIPLQVSAPFHCSLMRPAQEIMAAELSKTAFLDATCPVIANTTAKPTSKGSEFSGILKDQITQPVRWEQSMNRLAELGVTKVWEIGPGKVLAGLMKRIDPKISVVSISTVTQLTELMKGISK